MSSKDSYVREAPSVIQGFDSQEIKSSKQSRKKSTHVNHAGSLPSRNSSLNMNDEAGYNTKRKMSSKHGVEGLTSCQYGGKIASEQTVPWLHEDDNLSPKIVERSQFSRLNPSISKRYQHEMFDMEDRGLSKMKAKVGLLLYTSQIDVFHV